jgi:hypothetical protein
MWDMRVSAAPDDDRVADQRPDAKEETRMTESVELEAAQGGKPSLQPLYTLGSEPAERDRLRRQADELQPHARGCSTSGAGRAG